VEVEQDKVVAQQTVDLVVVVLIQVRVVLHLTQEAVQETLLLRLQLKEQMVAQVIHNHLLMEVLEVVELQQ